jgi:hypothetical protein
MTDSVDDIVVDDDSTEQELVDAAVIVASSLQTAGPPWVALQILSLATGMILCASSHKRSEIGDSMDMFSDQVNAWCDYEEERKTASWLKVT